MDKLRPYKKFVVSVIGVVAEVGNQLILPDNWQPWVRVVTALAVALGVYQVRNADQEAVSPA